jgi:hypothetical protein
MNEGEWHSWGQAIFIDEEHYSKMDRAVILVSVWAFIVLTLIYIAS